MEMLDQEAFARVIASGQHQPPMAIEGNDGEEGEEEPDGVDDATYHPSTEVEGVDPIWSLRMACLPVLDIFVSSLL
jgi:hypothetical protein